MIAINKIEPTMAAASLTQSEPTCQHELEGLLYKR